MSEPQMPPASEPTPSVVDRRLLHSSDIWISVLSVVVGSLVVFVPLLTGEPATRALNGATTLLPAGLATTLAIGGLISLAGILLPWRTTSYAWTLEQAGGLAVAGAWAGYSVLLAMSDAGTPAGVAITSILALAAGTRVLVVGMIEARTREATGRKGGRA